MLPIVRVPVMGLGNLLLLLIVILAQPVPIIFTPNGDYWYGIYIDGNYWSTTDGDRYLTLYNVHTEYHVFYAEATDCSESVCWYGSASPTIVCGENNILIYTYYRG